MGRTRAKKLFLVDNKKGRLNEISPPEDNLKLPSC